MITKPKFQITDMVQLERLAEQHLTLEEISTALGCSYETYNERSKENPSIAEAVKKGRLNGKLENVSQMNQLAKEGNVAAVLFLAKTKYGFHEKIALANDEQKPFEITVRYVDGGNPGN